MSKTLKYLFFEELGLEPIWFRSYKINNLFSNGVTRVLVHEYGRIHVVDSDGGYRDELDAQGELLLHAYEEEKKVLIVVDEKGLQALEKYLPEDCRLVHENIPESWQTKEPRVCV